MYACGIRMWTLLCACTCTLYHVAIILCLQIKNFTKPSYLLHDIEVCISNFTSFAILLL